MANGPQYETLWNGSLGDFNISRSKNSIIGQWLNSINVPTASMEDWDESSDVCLSLLNICFVFAHGSLQLYVNWVVLESNIWLSVCLSVLKHSLILLCLTARNIPVCIIIDFPSGPAALPHPVFFFHFALSAFWKLSKRCKICRRYAGMQNGH